MGKPAKKIHSGFIKNRAVFPERPMPRRVDSLIRIVPIVMKDHDTDEVHMNEHFDPSEED